MYLPQFLGRGVSKMLSQLGGEYAYLSRPRESYRPKVERPLNTRLGCPLSTLSGFQITLVFNYYNFKWKINGVSKHRNTRNDK